MDRAIRKDGFFSLAYRNKKLKINDLEKRFKKH